MPMVGPQAWLAEAAQTMPPATAAPAAPPPWPDRQPPAQQPPAWQQPVPPQQPATRQQPTLVGGPWASQEEQLPRVTARRRTRPIGLSLAAVAAVAAVIAGGLVVSDRLSPASDERSAGEATTGGTGEQGDGASPSAGAPSGSSAPLQPVSVTATCQAPPGLDAAGNPVTYEPQLTLDAVGATAWRCPGAAVGQQLVYDFGAPVTVTSVALVPGYAKVDPADGTDRFLENRTVTAVAWQFDDGRTERQDIAAPSAGMAEFQLPEAVTTRRVVLEIAGTGNDSAVRDFTAISDVRFAGS
ncbi:hypothetical protein [Blastococcus saxobsidens]|nr:hypothetical protein [Blastococcus saxobsidens]